MAERDSEVQSAVNDRLVFTREWFDRLLPTLDRRQIWSYPEDVTHSNPEDVDMLRLIDKFKASVTDEERTFWGEGIVREVHVRARISEVCSDLFQICPNVGVVVPCTGSPESEQHAKAIVQRLQRDRHLGQFLDLGIRKRAFMCGPLERTLSLLLMVCTEEHILQMMDTMADHAFGIFAERLHGHTGYGLLQREP